MLNSNQNVQQLIIHISTDHIFINTFWEMLNDAYMTFLMAYCGTILYMLHKLINTT